MRVILFIVVVVAVCQVQASTKIVLGTPVPPANRNTVAIFSFTSQVEQFCSGALIHPEWILTSATCVKMVEKYDMRVTSKNLAGMTAAIYKTALLIKDKIAHPNFDPNTLVNDIGLIQIEDHIDGDSSILKIPPTAQNIINTPGTVRGYGSTGNLVANDFNQKQSTVYITETAKCVATGITMNNKICTVNSVACKGDEGGPLISRKPEYVIGITSLDEKNLDFCGLDIILKFTPYTNVFLYRDWIRQTTKLNL